MHILTKIQFFFFAFSWSLTVIGQASQFEVRLITQKVDCIKKKAFVDIEIKASEGTKGFHLASQNYRFTFDPEVVENPKLQKELELSGLVQGETAPSMYNPHTMVGTKGSLVSYNVVLASGPGVFVTSDNWISIGRIEFDIKNINKLFNATWHDDQNEGFPKTIIIKKEQQTYQKMDGGKFGQENPSFKRFCSSSEDDRA
ncbi:MAG: hypothetical protein AAF502_25285 [Bacteroidota bacterium]